MLGWPKVRKAEIPRNYRDAFEIAGEYVVRDFQIQGGGRSTFLLPLDDLKKNDPSTFNKNATDWLTECSDKKESREKRLEIIQIILFVYVSLTTLKEIFSWFK